MVKQMLLIIGILSVVLSVLILAMIGIGEDKKAIDIPEDVPIRLLAVTLNDNEVYKVTFKFLMRHSDYTEEEMLDAIVHVTSNSSITLMGVFDLALVIYQSSSMYFTGDKMYIDDSFFQLCKEGSLYE